MEELVCDSSICYTPSHTLFYHIHQLIIPSNYLIHLPVFCLSQPLDYKFHEERYHVLGTINSAQHKVDLLNEIIHFNINLVHL